MKPQDQQELIDRFLQNKLQGQELINFKKKLKTDKSFADEVELQQITAKGIAYQGTKELRQRLEIIHQKVKDNKIEKEKSTRIVTLRRLVISVVAIALVIIIGINFWNSSPSNEDLFTEFYQTYEINFTTRTNASNNKTKAENAYRNGDFKNVIVLLEELKKEEANNSRLLLGLGNAYLNINDYSNAEINFNKIIRNNDELYIDQAKWYLALTHLKNKRNEESENLLRELANNETADFHQEAKALLNKIKE